jgi:CRP-like cAMP-binding protein
MNRIAARNRKGPPELPGNRLLAAMTGDQYERLRPHLRQRSFRRQDTLIARGERITEVVFPDVGVISLVATLGDGGTLEVGMIGADGAVGYQVLFEERTMPWDAHVQVSGSGRTLDVEVFLREAVSGGSLWEGIRRYVGESLLQCVQLAICNRHHSIQQRCARWLLMAQDRAATDRLLVTHDVLSLALGVHRPSISLAQEHLRAAGLIAYGHGKLSVIDRPGLQVAACECYSLLKLPLT